jgi:hypothetical protein
MAFEGRLKDLAKTILFVGLEGEPPGSILVAIEKLAPKGEVVAQLLGGAMIGVGVVRLVWDSLS